MSKSNRAQYRSSFFSIIRVGTLLSLAATGALAQFTFTTFDVPGANVTQPVAINNNGDIAGRFTDASGSHAFIRTADGTFTVFDSCSNVVGLNDLGEIAGDSGGSNGSCFRDRAGNVSTFALSQPGFSAGIVGLNNAGESIIKAFFRASGNMPFYFVQTLAGSLTSLPTPPGPYPAFLYTGLNNNGQATAYSFDYYFETTHGLLVDIASGQFTTMFDYSTIPQWMWSGTVAKALNDSGEVLGSYTDGATLECCYPPGGPARPFNFALPSVDFIASPGGQKLLSFLPPFSTPAAVGINQAGQVTGYYSDASGTHGYLGNPLNGTQPPVISLVEIIPGPPAQAIFSVLSSNSGIFNILSIPGATSDFVMNGSVLIDPFTPGQTTPIRVTATKLDQTKRSQVAIQAIDMAGNVTDFDPEFVTVYGTGGPPAEPLSGIPASESVLMIANGNPGLEKLRISVNDKALVVPLKPNEKRILNLQARMTLEANTVEFSGEGPASASASVVLKDGTPGRHPCGRRGQPRISVSPE